MNEWMNKQMNEWMEERVIKWVEEWMNCSMTENLNKWIMGSEQLMVNAI